MSGCGGRVVVVVGAVAVVGWVALVVGVAGGEVGFVVVAVVRAGRAAGPLLVVVPSASDGTVAAGSAVVSPVSPPEEVGAVGASDATRTSAAPAPHPEKTRATASHAPTPSDAKELHGRPRNTAAFRRW
jgi:hypothetical protein